MKTWKQTIKLLGVIAIVAVIGFAMVACASTPKQGKEVRAGDFRGIVSDNGITITYYTGENTDIQIPSEIRGLPVTAIRDRAFIPGRRHLPNGSDYRQPLLTSVIIPDSVTLIGRYAFAENQLTTITLPNSVTHIGHGAFARNQLTSIVIPNNVTHIEGGNLGTLNDIDSGATRWGAFALNRLTSVTIGNSVIEIGAVTFAGNQITSIVIPDSVTSIGDGAFARNRLTNVTISESVTIGNRAFEGNPQLANVPMSPRDREQARQRAEQEQAAQAELARIIGLYRQAGNNLGNLRNTSWSYSQRIDNRNTWNERIDFGDGSFIRQIPNAFFGGTIDTTGTYRVNGDTVIFLLDGEYSTGTIVGNSLTVSGGVMGNRVTFNRIQ